MSKHHGLSKTRLYSIWRNMKARCYKECDHKYKYYGGKGIKICDEWLNDFKCFYDWSMQNEYAEELTIDRIDSSKDYCPENCRWVTRTENILLSQGRDYEMAVKIGKTIDEERKMNLGENKYAPQKKYEAENVKRVMVKLNKNTDKDILSVLDMDKPLSTQLKQLIRKGLKK